MNYQKYEQKAHELRNAILDMTTKAGTGHITSSLSCVEILTALYYGNILKYDPKDENWKDRDYFIMSKAQASPLLYTVLADVGYYPKEDLELFAQEGGKLGVHLQSSVPGSEILSGSLGCGYGIAAGLALAFKKNRTANVVYSLLGDGECYEGAIWETAMFVAHNRLNNLITIVDRNYVCATHFVEDELSIEPFEDKWKAFGFEVKQIDGHSFEEIFNALKMSHTHCNSKPLVIIANTVKGKGIPMVENDWHWHGIAIPENLYEKAKVELNQEVQA